MKGWIKDTDNHWSKYNSSVGNNSSYRLCIKDNRSYYADLFSRGNESILDVWRTYNGDDGIVLHTVIPRYNSEAVADKILLDSGFTFDE